MSRTRKEWTNEEKGQPVVKGDLADLFEAQDKKIKEIGNDITLMMVAIWLLLAMLVLFVFAPELWISIKGWIGFIMRWMP